MFSSINAAGSLIINTLFDLYIFVLLIRIILVAIRVDYYNPISQFVVKLTQPIVNPVRKFIPNYKNIEISTVILVLVFEFIKFLLLGILFVGMPNVIGIFLIAFADALQFSLNIFFYAILIQAVMSWIQPGNTPITQILTRMTDPLMRPAQRIIPLVGGIDITPIPVMLGLRLIIILVALPLLNIGQTIAFT
ncbi:MAG: YggT family protein [Gammaproteobacteria bacterium]|nr:YggT family protein [Gammaproteobacteria bacterium]